MSSNTRPAASFGFLEACAISFGVMDLRPDDVRWWKRRGREFDQKGDFATDELFRGDS